MAEVATLGRVACGASAGTLSASPVGALIEAVGGGSAIGRRRGLQEEVGIL